MDAYPDFYLPEGIERGWGARMTCSGCGRVSSVSPQRLAEFGKVNLSDIAARAVCEVCGSQEGMMSPYQATSRQGDGPTSVV